MTMDDRAQDLLDQLREGRGQQKQINSELYRRMDNAESNIIRTNANIHKLEAKLGSMTIRIVTSASVFAGLVTALVKVAEAILP